MQQYDYIHDGRDCPIAGHEIVKVKFRNGTTSDNGTPARAWRWKWGTPFPDNDSHDIIEFSIVGKPAEMIGSAWTPTSGGYS